MCSSASIIARSRPAARKGRRQNAECGMQIAEPSNCGMQIVDCGVGGAQRRTERRVGVPRSRPAVRPRCGWSCGLSRTPRSCLAAEGNATDWKVGFDGVVEPEGVMKFLTVRNLISRWTPGGYRNRAFRQPVYVAQQEVTEMERSAEPLSATCATLDLGGGSVTHWFTNVSLVSLSRPRWLSPSLRKFKESLQPQTPCFLWAARMAVADF